MSYYAELAQMDISNAEDMVSELCRQAIHSIRYSDSFSLIEVGDAIRIAIRALEEREEYLRNNKI